MKRLIFTFLLALTVEMVYSQTASIYTVFGDVTVESASGKVHKAVLDEALRRTDKIRVGKGSAVSVYSAKAGGVVAIGEGANVLISDLEKKKLGTFARIVRMMRPINNEVHVSYKGEPFVPAGGVCLSLVDALTGQERLSFCENDKFVFKVTNPTEVPVCVAVFWRDSSGETVSCLEKDGRQIVIPANSMVLLTGYEMIAGAPFGTDDIYLAASEREFDPADAFKTICEDESTSSDHLKVEVRR